MTQLPTIKIKGKDYTMVKDRILFFNEEYPNGCIRTDLISEPSDQRVVIKATVTPDYRFPERSFADYSQAVIGDGMINASAALENACTSAIGRALACMGIGVIESIASGDEMNKAMVYQEVERQKKAPAEPTPINNLTAQLKASVEKTLTPEERAAAERTKLAEQQGVFSVDNDVLHCKIVGIQKKQTKASPNKPAREFLSVTFNGRLPNGANFASVFDTELYEALNAGLDKEVKLKIAVKGAYVNVEDVLWVQGIGDYGENFTSDGPEPLFEGA